MPSEGYRRCRKLYERDGQMKILEDAFRSAQIPGTPTQLVFVSGRSGTGKSSLIHAVFSQRMDCLYGSGKFEQKEDPKPFAALTNALAGIIFKMAESKGKYDFKNALKEHVTKEVLASIADFLPEIEILIQMDKPQKRNDRSLHRSKESHEKLKYALTLFMQTIASPTNPVVIFLDDLQWADPVSLMVLKSILSDGTTTNVLFVGSYRDNGVDKEHFLTQWLDEIQSTPISIALEDLTIGGVEALLSDDLGTHDVRDLAELVHNRTNGNVFHVLQFLDFLKGDHLLSFRKTATSLRWSWDISILRSRTSLSDNVVEIVRMKVNRLPEDTQTCLKVCSLLGFRFDENLLAVVSSGCTDENPFLKALDVTACLEIAIREGVLERLGNGWIKFVHDSLQEAVILLFRDDNERIQTNLQIGTLFWKKFTAEKPNSLEEMSDRYLFVCCDQLNSALVLVEDADVRLDVTKLNHEAAKRAATRSAFIPAINYLQIGLSLLNLGSQWIDQYQLSLGLYTSMVEMCFCAGRLVLCEKAVRVVLSHSKSIDDSIKTYLIWIQCLTAQANYTEQIDTSLVLLNQLGQKVDPNSGARQTRRFFEKTRQKLLAFSDDQILALPLMLDTRKVAAMQVLSEMKLVADSLEMYDLASNVICFMVNLTFDYGLTAFSAMGFALYGSLHVSRDNDIDSGSRLAGLALAIVDRLDASWIQPRVCLYCSFALHWHQPLSVTADSYFGAYEGALRNGDVGTALKNLTNYAMTYYYSGLPLRTFVAEMENFCSLMNNFGQKMFVLANVPLYQCVLNLTGQSEDVLDMTTGKACEYRDKLGWENRTGEQAGWSYSMQIFFYCEEFDLATQQYKKVEPIYAGATRALPLFQARVFFFALISIQNAKTSGKRKWRLAAKKHVETVRCWVVQKRAINVVHKLMILEAAMMTLEVGRKRKSNNEIERAFLEAIVAAQRSGFLQDAAVAAQIASRGIQSQELSEHFRRRSLDLYQRWGADGVVAAIERKQAMVAETTHTVPNVSYVGTSFRSRARFNNSIVLEHQGLELRGMREMLAECDLSESSS